MDNNTMQLFEDQPIRTAWDAEREEWYFSVVDVVGVLTDQKDQRGASNYWAKLKHRLKTEGADELLTNCQQLKLKSKDGKKRLIDVADPEQAIDRALETYMKKGYSEEWVHQRLVAGRAAQRCHQGPSRIGPGKPQLAGGHSPEPYHPAEPGTPGGLPALY